MPPSPPLIALRNAAITFGGAPLFSDISFSIARGERACLVGANGAGKSTILKVLAGAMELDAGERFVQPGTRIGYLAQSPEFTREENVAAALARAAGLTTNDYRVAAMLDAIGLDPTRPTAELSGGEGRRLALAQVQISEPDVLLLDEPTNHLDLPGIMQLEESIAAFRGGVLMISHDRAFLRRLSTRVLWLDRGRLFELDTGYGEFESWSQELLERQAQEQYRLKKRIEVEEYWLARGVTARRSRNEGRRRRLMALREEKARSLKSPGRAKLRLSETQCGPRLVIEALDIVKSYTGPDGRSVPVIQGFSTRIMRGDRIGIIGANGAGKTTLVNILTGAQQPDAGSVRIGPDVQIIRLDQKREIFDLDRTLWQTLAPGGGDSIVANGRARHVVAYLRDFLFDERQATMPVRSLSGGERARLILARLFARPGNLVVLDEPTNDLDLDTLDLLEEVLSDFDGTLLVVSHDRDFLDRLVTSTIVLEGGGRVREYAGGYSDYLSQAGNAETNAPRATGKAAPSASPRKPAAPPVARSTERDVTTDRLTVKEKRELEDLPARMDSIAAEISTLEGALSDPEFYGRDPEKFQRASRALEQRRAELHAAEERWLELAERA